MKNNYLYIVLILLLSISCSQVAEKKIEQKTVREKETVGKKINSPLYFEDFEPNDDQFARDNIVYTPKTKFTFDYSYTKDNVDYLYEQNVDEWVLFPKDSIKEHPNTVTNVTLEVAASNSMRNSNDGYNQTTIHYAYSPFKNFNMTGVVENKENLWMHPPRASLFRVLELNPFPYVKFPLEIGNTWNWSLKAGDHWSDKRWKTWKGNVDTFYTYKVTSLEKIDTPLGKLDCYVISSTGENRLGSTGLTAYFNEKYGFVRLDYLNIDGSTLQLKVIKVTN